MLNSAGYGSSLVINKAINIYGPDGVFGSLTTLSASATAIQVAAGAGDVIRIKGVNILGLDPTQGQGVEVDLCKRTELENMNIYHIGVGVKIAQDVHVAMHGLTISDVTAGMWSIGSNTAAQINGPTSPPLKVFVVNSKITGCNIGVQLDAGSFQMGNTNEISFASVDTYLISSKVTTCSFVSAGNGSYNNFTGVFNASCMCQVEDSRNGMQNNGNCNAN